MEWKKGLGVDLPMVTEIFSLLFALWFFFTYAGSELKVALGYQWGREGGALSLGARMEQDRFGDSRTTPWCKEGARDVPSQRAFFTRTQALCGCAPISMEIQDFSRRIWVCPSIFPRSWCVTLLRTHHWTLFPPSPLMEKVLDVGVR